HSLCSILEKLNNVMPPDTYSVQASSEGVTDLLPLALGVSTKEKLEAENLKMASVGPTFAKGKGCLVLMAEVARSLKDDLEEKLEVNVEMLEKECVKGCFRRGRRSGKKSLMGSKFMASGEECLDGWVGAGGGVVKGGSVVFEVVREDDREGIPDEGHSLCSILEKLNNVMPPDTYSVQASSGGVTDLLPLALGVSTKEKLEAENLKMASVGPTSTFLFLEWNQLWMPMESTVLHCRQLLGYVGKVYKIFHRFAKGKGFLVLMAEVARSLKDDLGEKLEVNVEMLEKEYVKDCFRRGRRSGKKSLMGSKFMASGEECLDGWVGAGGGVVKGGSVVFEVVREDDMEGIPDEGWRNNTDEH
nr:hypothetical protein [Tanacetum cinerariifolium]